MDKIGIVYDGNRGKDWAISSFGEEFARMGVKVAFFDINFLGPHYDTRHEMGELELPQMKEFVDEGYKIWMNRVYPSESSQREVNRCLNIFAWLGARNYGTINPLTACAADYDKFFAYQLMRKYNVPTPETLRLTPETSIESFLDHFSFPLIVKRSTGGKGRGVFMVEDLDAFQRLYEAYASGEEFVVQRFVKPAGDYDIRLGVIDGEPLICYGRKLVTLKGTNFRVGSVGQGSERIEHEMTGEESKLAVLASNSLGADLNVVDIQLTEGGPVVIENNLTPGYSPGGGEKWVELIVNHLGRKYA